MSAAYQGHERRAVDRLPRESRAWITSWTDVANRYTPDPVWRDHYGITDGSVTIEYPTLHAARMAAFIHNTVNGSRD